MDSVAFQFRVDFTDYALRSRLLSSIASKLTRLAVDRNIAVALINQITTKFGEKGSSSSSFLAPALGDTWAHACTSRVMLYWQDGHRYARLYKSPSRKNDCVPYMVTPDGVSGVPQMYRSVVVKRVTGEGNVSLLGWTRIQCGGVDGSGGGVERGGAVRCGAGSVTALRSTLGILTCDPISAPQCLRAGRSGATGKRCAVSCASFLLAAL